MIADKVRIFIKAGNGGDGAVSFHREKFVNAGGPDGGDGGDGGDIIFEASENTRTLMDFRYDKKFVAQNGENGAKNNMRGRSGEDMIIRVPAGTVISDEEGRVVADIKEGRKTVLMGGRGGKGNARFATPTRRTPRFSTPGRKTSGRYVVLELKTIADVGFVGFPNAGKSTLLSVISAAKPKIADYPFTTLNPNLGVVKLGEESFVAADIPGLIEGASEGTGLGHEFLRHIERTRMLVHIVDVSGMSGRDPVDDYIKIRKELEAYSPKLARKPEIVAANKLDMPESNINAEKLRKYLDDSVEYYEISAASHLGVKQLIGGIIKKLRDLPPIEDIQEDGVIEDWHSNISGLTFELTRGIDGITEVNGSAIDEIFMRIDPNDPASMRHFEKLLEDFGIVKALRDYGVKDGETVRMNGEEFDFVD